MTPLIKSMLESNLKIEMDERLVNPSLTDCQRVYCVLVSELLSSRKVSAQMKESLSTITHMIIERGGYVYGK